MIVNMLAAALSLVAAHVATGVDPSYEVTDRIVSADQMRTLESDPKAPVTGEIVDQVSIRPAGSDATLRLGEIGKGRPFLGTRIDVRMDETVVLTNSSHGTPASVSMQVDRSTGFARGTYVVDDHGHREHHLVTVQRQG